MDVHHRDLSCRVVDRGATTVGGLMRAQDHPGISGFPGNSRSLAGGDRNRLDAGSSRWAGTNGRTVYRTYL